MKTITLKKMVLENFRGISETFEFNPGRNVFSGPNGSGKTTLFDGSKYTHDGENSQGQSKFALKTIKDGKQLSKTDHSSFLEYDIDGTIRQFGRVFHEKWNKNGTVKIRNETDYYIDGMSVDNNISVTATVFKKTLYEWFGDKFQHVSDIHYVATMPWKERRELLTSLAPGVKHGQIIDSIPGFRELLGSRSIEDAKTAADQRKKKIDKELEQIKADIKANKAIVDGVGGNIDDAAAIVLACDLKVKEAEQAINEFSQGCDKVEQLRELNTELAEEEDKFSASQFVEKRKNNKRLEDINCLQIEIDNCEFAIKNTSKKLQELGKEWKAIKAKTVADIKTDCEICGQELPAEKFEELKDSFMADRSKALEENKIEGEETAQVLKDLKAKLEAKTKEKTDLEAIGPPTVLSVANSPEVEVLRKKIEDLKKVVPSEVPGDLLQALETAKAELSKAQQQKADVDAVAKAQTALDNAKSKKKGFSAEIDKITTFLTKYQEYNDRMAEAIEGPVNALFENARFRMFETLEDGRLKPACEVLDKEMRPYNGALSNGEQIQLGLDIVRTMQRELGIKAPIWIDNSESVTGSIDLDCQFVELRAVCRAGDEGNEIKTLTKEV